MTNHDGHSRGNNNNGTSDDDDGAATTTTTTTTTTMMMMTEEEEEEEDNATLLAVKVREQCEHWEKTYRSHTRYGRSCPCGDAVATGQYLISCDPVSRRLLSRLFHLFTTNVYYALVMHFCVERT